jgi:hypothetical protein
VVWQRIGGLRLDCFERLYEHESVVTARIFGGCLMASM